MAHSSLVANYYYYSVTIGKGFGYESDDPDALPPPDKILPHFSRVDPNDSAQIESEFPNFKGVPCSVIDLQPGQMLFIPAGYLHEVRSYGYKPSDMNDTSPPTSLPPNPTGLAPTPSTISPPEDGVHIALNWWYVPPLPGAHYRSPYAPPSPHEITVKFLLHPNAAGAIIGKGGVNKDSIQATSRVKSMIISSTSKKNPYEGYFPGTNMRVCSVTGGAEEVKVSPQPRRFFAAKHPESVSNALRAMPLFFYFFAGRVLADPREIRRREDVDGEDRPAAY